MDEMPMYQCHKKVRAKPMTRGEYNALRGWELPINEDPADAGYLVEYLDGGAPNHPDYEHYISWSPKAVFDAGYTLAPKDFRDRVRAERDELAERFGKLSAFIDTQAYAGLPQIEREALSRQYSAMSAYLAALEDRISRFAA